MCRYCEGDIWDRETLGLLLIATNSNIIVEQRVCILIATYVIGTIAGLFGAFIGFLEIGEEENL